MSDARRAIESVAEQLPMLGYSGFRCVAYPRDAERQRAYVEADRLDLLKDDAVAQVATCLAYIARLDRIKTPSVSSYGMKHRAESWGRRNGWSPYVSNGSFIVAAVFSGCPVYAVTGPNCRFGFSRRSIARVAHEGGEP